MLEATCTTCGDTFIPADENDREHVERENGDECGGTGQLAGQWTRQDAFRPTMDARETKSLMRDAVRLTLAAKAANRTRDEVGMPPAALHPDLVDALATLADHGFTFDPNLYSHPSDVDDLEL